MVHEGSINSRELLDLAGGFTTKLYTFSKALDEGIFPNIDSVRHYLNNILVTHPEITVDPHQYAIAMAWGYKEAKKPVQAMDIFSYKFDKPWGKCNPDVDGWVFKNYEHDPGDRAVTCETGTIILGKEAQLRRLTKTLKEYINRWPDLEDLGPVVK